MTSLNKVVEKVLNARKATYTGRLTKRLTWRDTYPLGTCSADVARTLRSIGSPTFGVATTSHTVRTCTGAARTTPSATEPCWPTCAFRTFSRPTPRL